MTELEVRDMQYYKRELDTLLQERANKIVSLHDDEGLTFGSIAVALGITRQRVEQIYHREKERRAGGGKISSVKVS